MDAPWGQFFFNEWKALAKVQRLDALIRAHIIKNALEECAEGMRRAGVPAVPKRCPDVVEIAMKLKGLSLAAALVLAASAFAQTASAQMSSAQNPPPPPGRYDPAPSENTKYAWADVLRVDPVYDRVQTSAPREECEDVPVERRVDGGNNNGAGTVIGAIVGGVLGSTVGKGDGRKAATVAGAVVGGAVGHGVASQDDGYYEGPERHCRVVQDVAQERRIVAYDVQYRYRGDVYMSRLDYDPGERMRVRVSIAPAD